MSGLRDLAAGVYLSEDQNPMYTSIQYAHSHREGGGVEPERRGKGQQFTKLGRKYQHD